MTSARNYCEMIVERLYRTFRAAKCIWQASIKEAPPLIEMSQRLTRVLHLIIMVVIAAGLIGYMFWFGIDHGMNKVLPNPLTSRTTQLGAAISDVAYGLDLRHAANAKVVDFLLNNGISDSPEILGRLGLQFPDITRRTDVLNSAIQRAAQLDGIDDHINLAEGTLAFTKMEDLGIIDFYKLSFRLFGFNIDGFYYTYFVLLSWTVIVAFVPFWNRIGILCIINVILVGELFTMEYIAYHHANPDILTVHSGRFLSVLGIIPAFQMLVMLWRPPQFQIHSLVSLALQVVFLVYVISARGSMNWATIVLVGSVLVLVGVALRRLWSTQPVSEFVKQVLTWPLVAMCLFAIAADSYIKSQIHPAYYLLDELLPTHYTWHSMIMGLGVGDGYGEPSLDDVAPQFKGVRADPLASLAVEGYLAKVIGIKNFLDYFASNVLPQYGRPKTYERFTRAEYLRFIEENPWFWMRLTFAIKPTISAEMTWGTWVGILDQDGRNILLLLVAVVATIATIRLSPIERSDFLFGLGGLAAMVPAAALPAIVAYPAPHTLGDAFTVLSSLAVGLAAYGMKRVLDLIRLERAKIVSWLSVIVVIFASWIGVIVVIFASWAVTGMVSDLVRILLLRFGGGVHLGLRFYLLPAIVPAILILLIFGVGAALMRAKFRGATVWKTIASLAVVFGMLRFIMGITG